MEAACLCLRGIAARRGSSGKDEGESGRVTLRNEALQLNEVSTALVPSEASAYIITVRRTAVATSLLQERLLSIGYSGTPLAKKLGIKEGQRTWRHGMPPSVAEEIARSGSSPALLRVPTKGIEMAHIFVTERNALARMLSRLRGRLDPAGTLWVSWPKKSAKVQTDISEQIIRDEALPLGFVDVKVCAIDEIWSGLKLVIRKRERTKV